MNFFTQVEGGGGSGLTVYNCKNSLYTENILQLHFFENVKLV